MKKLLIPLAIACASIAPTSAMNTAPEGYTLEKVVLFSRHGIRAPLIGYGSALAEATPHAWPEWQTEGGHLTPKGAELEKIFAAYFDQWFDAHGLIAAKDCPADKILIYTNSMPRTIESGTAFAEGAFAGCDVKVHHLEDIGKMDNTFNPIVRSPVDDAFIAKAQQSIDAMIGDGGFEALNARLADSYTALENVLDYPQSLACKEKKTCELDDIANSLVFEQGKEPKTAGALRNGTGAGDSFILQYYEGFPDNDIAWGKIADADAWKKIIHIKDTYNDVLFGSPVIAKEAATPLLTFIQNAFADHGYDHPLVQPARNAKAVLLVGHDSNVGSLLPLLKTAPYTLPGQYEKTPISGKIAFEQWRDKDGKPLMKIEYFYQTGEQLRNATALDANNPPQRVTLHIGGCPTDANGYCALEDFEKAVSAALAP